MFQKLDKNENGFQNSANCCLKKPKNKESIYKVKSPEKEIRYLYRAQSFTSLMADLCQDIKRVS